MDRADLLARLAFLNAPDEPVDIELYFVLEVEHNMVVKFANIQEEVSTALLRQFLDYIDRKLIHNDELIFADLTDADDRRNSAFSYNLEDKPEKLNVLSEVVADRNKPVFDFRVDSLSDIRAFVVLIGNDERKAAIYKKHYPVNLLKRDSILRIFPANEQFERLDTNVLNINESFEFLEIDGNLVVLSLKVLETNFGYENIVRAKATENLALIQAAGLLEDMELISSLTAELKYAKKMMKIRANTPVLQLPPAAVIHFIGTHPMLRKKIRFTADNSRISLDTRVSQELFLKLLNDDFLKSELTNLFYDSQNKDTMRLDEAAE
jgi:hypothetical protein